MIRINLAPEKAGRRRGLALQMPAFNLGLLFAVIYLVAIAGVGAYWWLLSSEAAELKASVDQKSRELAQLRATIGQVNKVKEETAELRKRVDVIEQLTKNQSRPIMMVDAFANVIPRDLWITGMEERGNVLRLTGSAFSTTAVSDFMANLRSSGKFKDIDIVISRRDLARPSPLVTFEVTCRFEG